MADDTDALFGLILFILFLALLGYAAGGMGSSPSSAGPTSATTQSLPPLSGDAVASCPDTFTPAKRGTDGLLTLQVYVDPADPGRKCATASTTSSGTLKVTLAYTAEQTQMVSNTASCQTTGQNCMTSVLVSGTDDYCVSAVADKPATSASPGDMVTISRVVEPCSMVPAMQPTDPWPDSTVRADDLEDEEGY